MSTTRRPRRPPGWGGLHSPAPGPHTTTPQGFCAATTQACVFPRARRARRGARTLYALLDDPDQVLDVAAGKFRIGQRNVELRLPARAVLHRQDLQLPLVELAANGVFR